MKIRSLKAVSYSDMRPNQFWLVSIFVSFILIGCEPLTEIFPPLSPKNSPVDTPPTAQPLAQSSSTAKMGKIVEQSINKIREQNGLNTLKNNEKLAQVARNYSRQMARDNFFSHTGSDNSTLPERVRSGGIYYRVVGENLFKSINVSEPVPLAIEGWMNSPGHRENILRPAFTQTGIGIWKEGNTYYMTQLFMQP
jgi:uncharacterized protein YkwD